MTDITEGSSEATELAVAQAAQGGIKGRRPLADLVRDNLSEIEKALPPGIMDAERFNRIVLTELRRTPKLLVCTPESFFGALFQTAQLGLEPGGSLGHAFLIPYDNSRLGVTECQLQIGYKGFVELGGRRGILIKAREVRAGDDFDFELGSNEHLHHSYKLDPDNPRAEQPVIGYYGKVVMSDGKTTFHVMDKSEINKRRDRSSAVRSGRNTPWNTDYDAMARKTVIRAMVPQIALAPDLQIALRADEAIVQRGDQGDLSYLYRDAIDIPAQSAAGPTAEDVTSALNDLPNAERLACSKYLLDNFGPVDQISEDAARACLTIAQEWPAVLGRDIAHDPTTGEIPPEATEAPSEPFDIESGMDGQDEPADDTAPQEVGAVDNLEADTALRIQGWNTDTVKRVLRDFEQPTSGNAAELRERLVTFITPLRARGDKAVTDLF